jgi:hypothetical protein
MVWKASQIHWAIRSPRSGACLSALAATQPAFNFRGRNAGAASRPSMSPRLNQRSRKPSSERSWARAFARQMPLIPPADVPAITSTTTRVRTCSRSALASSERRWA